MLKHCSCTSENFPHYRCYPLIAYRDFVLNQLQFQDFLKNAGWSFHVHHRCYFYVTYVFLHRSSPNWKGFGALFSGMLFSYLSMSDCVTCVVVILVCWLINKGLIWLPAELTSNSPFLPLLVSLSSLAAAFLLLFIRHLANKVITALVLAIW